MGRLLPVVTVREFFSQATCYAGAKGRVRPEADETTEKEMAPVHGGAMGVMSYVRRTIFTFNMPAV